MSVFVSFLVSIIVYVVTFKHEYTKEEFAKTTPILIILGVLTLLFGMG